MLCKTFCGSKRSRAAFETSERFSLNTLSPSLQYELEQSTSFSLHTWKLARNILSDEVRATVCPEVILTFVRHTKYQFVDFNCNVFIFLNTSDNVTAFGCLPAAILVQLNVCGKLPVSVATSQLTELL